MKAEYEIPAVPTPALRVALDVPSGTFPERVLAMAAVRALEEGKSLAGRCLASADFGGMDLADVDFAGADLSDASFAGATLRRVSFRGAGIHGVNFGSATLADVDLSGVSATGVGFERATASDLKLKGADLHEALFVGAVLDGFDAGDAKLTSPVLTGCTIGNGSLVGATISDAKDAEGLVLKGVDLTRAFVEASDLGGVKFEGCKGERFEMDGVRMKGGRFAECVLPMLTLTRFGTDGTEFLKLDAQGASVKEVTLTDSRLTDCDLRRISGVDLTVSKGTLERVDLAGLSPMRAYFLDGTTMRSVNLKDGDTWVFEVADGKLSDCDFTGFKSESTSMQRTGVADTTFEGASLGHADIDVSWFEDAECLEAATLEAPPAMR